MSGFLCAIRDTLIALLRLGMLQFILFFTGLNHILFNRVEISNVALTMIPQRRDRDKLAFVDDLKVNNLDMLKEGPLPPADCTNFTEDDDDVEEKDIDDISDDEFNDLKDKDDDDTDEGQK